jgi:hypothetical protein
VRAEADIIAMRPISMILALMLLLSSGAAAQATDPNVLAPYRFQPAPQTLSPLEQQKALVYRNQVQNQLRQLEQQRQPPKGARDPLLLPQTRSELDRMNGLIQQQP